jgi:hypothetical protein
MRGAEIDRAVFEVDDDPVESGTSHDLHGLDAGNGGDRAEGRAAFAPFFSETVEGGEGCGGQFAKLRSAGCGDNSTCRRIAHDAPVLTERRALRVIASEAKQSIYPLAEAWIASSQVLLAMTG